MYSRMTISYKENMKKIIMTLTVLLALVSCSSINSKKAEQNKNTNTQTQTQVVIDQTSIESLKKINTIAKLSQQDNEEIYRTAIAGVDSLVKLGKATNNDLPAFLDITYSLLENYKKQNPKEQINKNVVLAAMNSLYDNIVNSK
ncbi:hypothetical protein [Oceanivirga salmonicida]|uniref:hypothetical protein n=1 Tax=Oceanivirga salmonicida TaxID=1769291 RepID=UPI0012E27AE4|nr:hypothetical protein [Oceanivirga salmonicida]